MLPVDTRVLKRKHWSAYVSFQLARGGALISLYVWSKPAVQLKWFLPCERIIECKFIYLLEHS